MGTPNEITTRGMILMFDGHEIGVWSRKTALARSGYHVWTLTPEQVAQLTSCVVAGELDQHHPMRRFHR